MEGDKLNKVVKYLMETGHEHSTHPIGQEEGFKMQDKWKFLVFNHTLMIWVMQNKKIF